MSDLSWLSQEARTIHDIFMMLFYSLATVFLALGVVLEYFKVPLGGMPAFAPLVGRVLIAALLLHSYPEVANVLGDLTDALGRQLGDLNQFHNVLSRMGDKLGEFTWSWTSLKETTTLILSFITFFLLYISIYIANAGVIYIWVLLYVFSPLLIALFILPATAGATRALYQSIFEVCAWKIVWSVLATLLWSAALSEINKPSSDINFLTVIAFNLILAVSVLFTPIVVHALAGKGLTGMVSGMMGMAAGASVLSPGVLANGMIRKTTTRSMQTGVAGFSRMKRAYFSKDKKEKTKETQED